MYLDNRPVVRGGALAVPATPPQAARTGSLWRDNVSANFLFSDVKARYPGDLITIVVSEDASGSKDAVTSSKTKTAVSGSLEQFFGLPQQLQEHQPNINPAALIQANADREWDGEGSTARRGKLTARMTAQVTEVAPNGNLWVEGEKIVSVNYEDQHLVLAGWVRPEDINAQNEVLSSRLALGRVDFYGVGVVGMKQRPGWGYWLLDWVWPF
jgi:flagellar L-ring protein precursor FlgH